MKISILAIGDEVIKGKSVNTDAAFIATELEKQGIKVVNHMACLDECQEITKALHYLLEETDVVITSGGLGPTIDDITKECVAQFFNEELELYPEVLEIIKNLFEKRNMSMPLTNKKQALFIKGSTVIPNHNGSAPGMIYEKNGKTVIVLPGPPNELNPMFINDVLPYLMKDFSDNNLIKHYRLMNIGESHVDEIIGFMYEKYSDLKIAPYAGIGHIDFIIVTNVENKQSFDAACQIFENLLGDYIIGDWSRMIHEIIVEKLIAKGLTIATAESCTGGMLSSMIVDVPGCSAVFNEGFVTYSNEAKIKHLGVDETVLDQNGAVSAEVAYEMASKVAKVTDSRIGLSTTGIAGPTGGTSDKPVGLVYMGISIDGKTRVYKMNFSGNREKVRMRTCLAILYFLYRDFIKTL
jgi:nicotinamide-nucleotide amidase